SGVLLVHTDDDDIIGLVRVRGHRQVQGSRLRFIDATSHVVLGAMARTEVATQPISTEIRRRDFRTERRGTSQMRTETDNNQQLRLDRTILRVDIGRLHRSLGLWISHLRGNLLQIPENLLGTTHDKYRLTA